MYHVDDISCDVPPAAVNNSLPRNSDIFLIMRKNQRRPHLPVIVSRIERPNQHCSFFKVQRHVRLKMNGACQIPANKENEPASAILMDMINGILDGSGIERNSVRIYSKQRGTVIFSLGGKTEHAE